MELKFKTLMKLSLGMDPYENIELRGISIDEEYRITMGPEILQRKLPLRVPTVAQNNIPTLLYSPREKY